MIFERKKKDSELLAISFLNQKVDNLYTLITKLIDKITLLEKSIEEIKEDIMLIKTKLKTEESVVPLGEKTKELIKVILKRHPFLTAKQIGEMIGLSRTRTVEYLVEMEEQGIIKSKIEGKKKLYYLP